MRIKVRLIMISLPAREASRRSLKRSSPSPRTLRSGAGFPSALSSAAYRAFSHGRGGRLGGGVLIIGVSPCFKADLGELLTSFQSSRRCHGAVPAIHRTTACSTPTVAGELSPMAKLFVPHPDYEDPRCLRPDLPPWPHEARIAQEKARQSAGHWFEPNEVSA